MATIRKRGSTWQVQVRKTNHPLKSKTFRLKADAVAWARRVEVDLDRDYAIGMDLDLRKVQVRDLLARYQREVTSQKKSFAQESAAIDQLIRENFADVRISDVGPADFAAFRDRRLKIVKPATVVRQLSILQNAFNVAKQVCVERTFLDLIIKFCWEKTPSSRYAPSLAGHSTARSREQAGRNPMSKVDSSSDVAEGFLVGSTDPSEDGGTYTDPWSEARSLASNVSLHV